MLIIAEAAKHIPPELKASHANVPWRQIHGPGNLLRHEYRRIDPNIFWSVVTDHLGDLDAAAAATGHTAIADMTWMTHSRHPASQELS